MNTICKTAFCFALACTAAWAQTSQINGTIKDPSGSAIPGAAIKATQTATGQVRNTTSGADGNYVIPNLPTGPYQVEVTKEGFSKSQQTGIVLQVDSNLTVDVALAVGAVSEQVTVEATAATVETRSTAIGTVVTNQQVSEMPLNGRDPHELIFLAGMATYPGAGSYNTIRNYPTVAVSVAGGNGDGVAYLLDGVLWQDPYNSLSLPLPFPDALQEFKLETSAAPAQYGYHATATVNAITKSGTNEYHGDLFEFLRNGDLNARDFEATARDTLKRNQFGGVVGGPVLPRFKNKLFFFGGFQRTSLRSDSSQNVANIPNAASLTGDFTSLASPACNSGVQKTLSAADGFVNNTISPSLLNPVMVNVMKTLPVTNNPCGRVIYPLVAGSDESLYTAKMDWQISDKSSFFGRFMLGDLAAKSTYDGTNPLSINTYGYHDYDYGIALGYTYLFSANLVSSTHLGANRTNVAKTPDNYHSWADFGANVSPLGGNMIEIVSSAFNVGGGGASLGAQHNGPMPHLAEDLTWIKGNHQILFGGGIYQQRLNYLSGPNANGNATFTGSNSGLILGDVMLGLTSTFVQGTVYGFYDRQFYDSLYVADNWKITPRLTLNYGLRWEPYLSPYNSRGENEVFSPSAFAAGTHSSVFVNAPAGLFFPGDSQYTSGNYGHNYYNGPVWAKFYPRLGLAWDPEGKGRMTIRAAYGMFGDRAQMLAGTATYFDAPFGDTVTQTGANMTNPFASAPGGVNPFPVLNQFVGIGVYSPNAPFPLNGAQITSPLSNFHPVYMNQWNLSIQRQMGKDWLVTANYVGNNTIHMISGENENQSVFMGTGPCQLYNDNVLTNYPVCSTTGNANARRVLNLINPQQGQYYSTIGTVDDGGTAEYEGLYLSARKTLSHNLSLLANYTWSHCISDVYNFNPGTGGVAPYGARRQWRSNCIGIDLRQEVVLNLVATTPKFSNRWARAFGSNWQVAPILEIKSATNFSIFTGTDQALTTAVNQPPNLVNPNPYPANQTLSNWINSSAFAPATPGTYGNLGYNNMKGPGIFQLNVAFSRTFQIGEKRAFQLRAEAFNLSNHVNGFAPGVSPINAGAGANDTLNSSTFQSVTSDISGNNGLQGGDYRVVQVAAKFVF
ncbi:MAG: carboxypeptidase-like regulatory domain-containing protein [Bryobacteraceae bacterium]|jgi:hypothetical protein